MRYARQSNSIGESIAIIVFALVIVGFFSSIAAAIFWWLWNWIAAGVFGAPSLTFFQAWGLLFLIGMIRGVIVKVKETK